MTVSQIPTSTLVTFDPITTAVTAQVSATVIPKIGRIEALHLYAVFAYGSGGTTCKCWVQTSLDNGVTWVDIGAFAFTTAAAKKGLNIISSASVVAASTFSDGTMADDTGLSGYLGQIYRTKITTTGTYAGATSLNVYAVPK